MREILIDSHLSTPDRLFVGDPREIIDFQGVPGSSASNESIAE